MFPLAAVAWRALKILLDANSVLNANSTFSISAVNAEKRGYLVLKFLAARLLGISRG